MQDKIIKKTHIDMIDPLVRLTQDLVGRRIDGTKLVEILGEDTQDNRIAISIYRLLQLKLGQYP